MSQAELSGVVSKILKEVGVKYATNATTGGGKEGKETGTRYLMDKEVSLLEISVDNTLAGTKIQIYEDFDVSDKIVSGNRLSTQQAKLITRAAIIYYEEVFTPFSSKHFAECQALAQSNPEVWMSSGSFEALYTPTSKNKMLVRVVKGGTNILVFGTHTAVVIAPSFARIRESSSDFSREFDTFMDTNSSTTRFKGVFTVHELLEAGKYVTTKTSSGMRDLMGTTSQGYSQIHIGHISSATDPTKRSVAQVTIDSSLSDIADNKELAEYLNSSQIKNLIRKLKQENMARHVNLYAPFFAEFTKHTKDLNKLKLLFRTSYSYVWHVASLNSNLSKEIIGLNILEKDLKDDLLSDVFIEKILNNNKIITMKGSIPWLTGVINTITHAFMTGIKKAQNKVFKVKVPRTERGTNTTTKVKGEVKIPISNKIKRDMVLNVGTIDTSKTKTSSMSLNIKIPASYLKDKEDAPCISASELLSIQGTLSYALHDQIKANMHKPSLVYRTGRFAKSVKIAGLRLNPDCSITAFYRYRVAPYAVFDPEISNYRGLSSPARNPRKIIGDSIRSIAVNVMKDKYIIHPQWV